MNTYQIRYVEGKSSSKNGDENFFGLRYFQLIEAPSRMEAFKEFHRTIDSGEITGLAHPYGSPIGFSKNEIQELKEAGISLKAGFPQNGIQVEEIALKES